MIHLPNNSTITGGRRGLAPLELVLSIPLMMIMLALMIIIGTAGSWKLRTQSNSRQAAYRSIWPRAGNNDPKPDAWWPRSARMSFRESGPDPFPVDPFAEHVVVRGPAVGPGGRNILTVREDWLDMQQGLNEGYAAIDRELPLFRRLDYQNSYRRSNQIFADEQWQHGQMGIANVQRRIPDLPRDDRHGLYEYANWDELAERGGQTGAVRQAAGQLMTTRVVILDRDDELRAWYSGGPYIPFRSNRYGGASVYPMAAPGCNLSRCSCPGIDLRIHVDNLLEEIEDVPRDLTDRFLSMYLQQLAILDSTDPPPPGAAQLRADLQQKIDQLRQFRGTLPP